MKPGRELDLLVAEKVMEHKIDSFGFERTNDYDGTDLKNYSTDISAAWEILKILQQFHSTSVVYNNHVKSWSVFIGDLVDISSFESAPHAICLAALKAKGVEK
jgi:hypothetical protein